MDLLAPLTLCLLCAAPAGPPADLQYFVPEAAEGARVQEAIDRGAKATGGRLAKLTGQRPQVIAARLQTLIAKNLAAKRALRDAQGRGFPLTAAEIERTVVGYEAYKLESYVTSGVFPKRYFGYFDEKWNTADLERSLRATTHSAVAVCNAYLAQRKARFRVTDAEVAVTFVAEGGALLLDGTADAKDVHPIYGIGLDDIATGFRKHGGLVAALDRALGARLGEVVAWRGSAPVLTRNFTFEEAVLGTAVMFVYEKEIAQARLQADGLDLAALPLDRQFIVSSLVYNSGRLFDASTREALRAFATADYLFAVSERNRSRRAALNVLPPAKAFARLEADGDYPPQPTSWSAVYHVLQRYGAYVALKRFTSTFDAADQFPERRQ